MQDLSDCRNYGRQKEEKIKVQCRSVWIWFDRHEDYVVLLSYLCVRVRACVFYFKPADLLHSSRTGVYLVCNEGKS